MWIGEILGPILSELLKPWFKGLGPDDTATKITPTAFLRAGATGGAFGGLIPSPFTSPAPATLA